MFNFGTKIFIIRMVIDDVTTFKMWSYEQFVDKMELLGRVLESFFMILIPLSRNNPKEIRIW